MKIFARLCFGLAVLLTVGGLPAQPVPSPAPEAVLPASSPYGEALVITNIPYLSHPTARQNFDLYLPRKRGAEPFPLVIWVHGGAWMKGLKEWDNVKYLVKHGYAIASVDYRFSPEAPFPAQIQDCNAAMNFILAHAADYGVSAKRFVVGGGSAGGHLALLLGLARQEREFGADPAIRPLAILDFFGPADLNRMKADLVAEQSKKGLDLYDDAGPKLMGEPLDQAAAKIRLASPMTYVDTGNPPVLILQGGKDDLVPAAQSERLHAALDRVGVMNQLILVPDAGHDGPTFSTPDIAATVVHFLDVVMASRR
jgi:acetyl esterase/lipase